MMAPTLSKGRIQKDIIAKLSEYKFVEKFEGSSIYEINDQQFDHIATVVDTAAKLRKAFKVMPNAVILSIVSTFDALISDIAKQALLYRPERITNSQRSYSASEIFKASSFAEFLNYAVENEVEKILWDSHQEQIKKFESLFGFSITEHYPQWGEFIEVFERRNLIAHGVKVTNATYQKNCKAASCPKDSMLKIGENVSLDSLYLRKSTDHLVYFLLVFIWNIWIRLDKSNFEEAYTALNAAAFQSIRDKRYTLASRLLEALVDWESEDRPERIRRMMVINLANAYRFLDEIEKSENALKRYDWENSSYEFQICERAVCGNVDGVCELMKKLSDEAKISRSDYKVWPVFHWVREKEKFRETYAEVFEEDFYVFESTKSKKVEDQVEDD
ncbi:hypothetical protein K3148_11465 [Qipengyuania aurantiaca]|uniref:Apea-like HEPN domain-containing protein n=1 Tax=Qipengyuania aurantiaca TaxID=2867233 RepID=A0ABX8ZK84_9SPHN|nr:hypothetical protein [Qipengyuania aurantiaca]QZD89423.1 hypothetical protein K3148_11465 [Qipengyuania aurantiaca]